MPYTNSQATPRSDIYALVMQASAEFNKLLIADQVLPVKGEDVKRGIYMKAKLANAELLNADAKPRESGAVYTRVNRKFDTDLFDTQEYGLESVIDDSYEAEVVRFMNLEATEAALLDRSLRLSYEGRVKALAFATGTFNATAATVNYTAANLATIDISNDVDLARGRLLKKGIIPNAAIMSFDLFQRARRTPLLQNQVYGVVPRAAGQRALPGVQDIAQALGVEHLLIGQAPKNSNDKGQAYVGAFIWTPDYISVACVQGGEYQAGGIGRTIQWTKDTTGLITPETYRDDTRRSNILRCRMNTAEKIIDETAAELVTTNYA